MFVKVINLQLFNSVLKTSIFVNLLKKLRLPQNRAKLIAFHAQILRKKYSHFVETLINRYHMHICTNILEYVIYNCMKAADNHDQVSYFITSIRDQWKLWFPEGFQERTFFWAPSLDKFLFTPLKQPHQDAWRCQLKIRKHFFDSK